MRPYAVKLLVCLRAASKRSSSGNEATPLLSIDMGELVTDCSPDPIAVLPRLLSMMIGNSC
eukprot:2195663-Prorocentrum_lima.AAC.1